MERSRAVDVRTRITQPLGELQEDGSVRQVEPFEVLARWPFFEVVQETPYACPQSTEEKVKS
jgi:hypothetical protein